jgi:uroporphyrinogen-III synthase
MRCKGRVGEHAANVLKGKRVVVTRALEQSESLVEALRDAGAVPVVVPMVAFGTPDDARAVDAAIRGGAEFDWLLLTSQNAMRALQERSESLGFPLADALRGIHIAAVGPATAQAAGAAGLVVEYVAVKHRGVELAEELGKKIEGKNILLPRSDRANPELVKKLEELGARVKDVVAYKTVRPDEQNSEELEKIIGEGVDAVLFFSPSAVHHFREVLGEGRFEELSRRAVFAAIGPVTEKTLRETKTGRVVVARDTTVNAVIAVLTEYFMARRAKLPAGAKLE